jgi:hypothetical protein
MNYICNYAFFIRICNYALAKKESLTLAKLPGLTLSYLTYLLKALSFFPSIRRRRTLTSISSPKKLQRKPQAYLAIPEPEAGIN